MTNRQMIIRLTRAVQDRDATIERLEAGSRIDAARHESSLREIDRLRSRVAELEVADDVDRVYGDLFARYEGLA